MEVHHHPHVEKKNFKGYFLEFVMIFLAVTLGFFAESLRENITDSAKEKEYILSMIADAKTDTANIRGAISLNSKRILYLDSLAEDCYNYNPSYATDSDIYKFYRRALVHPDFISPTERTLSQLKNSGSMSLIRKKAAADSIVMYDDMAKKLADQQAYYERYQNETVQSSFSIINFKYYKLTHLTHGVISYTDAKLMNTDKLQLIEFGNRVNIYAGVVSFYNVRLEEMNEHAMNLINTLKKEYRLSDD